MCRCFENFSHTQKPAWHDSFVVPFVSPAKQICLALNLHNCIFSPNFNTQKQKEEIFVELELVIVMHTPARSINFL